MDKNDMNIFDINTKVVVAYAGGWSYFGSTFTK